GAEKRERERRGRHLRQVLEREVARRDRMLVERLGRENEHPADRHEHGRDDDLELVDAPQRSDRMLILELRDRAEEDLELAPVDIRLLDLRDVVLLACAVVLVLLRQSHTTLAAGAVPLVIEPREL